MRKRTGVPAVRTREAVRGWQAIRPQLMLCRIPRAPPAGSPALFCNAIHLLLLSRLLRPFIPISSDLIRNQRAAAPAPRALSLRGCSLASHAHSAECAVC
jgi:hypothetical protein